MYPTTPGQARDDVSWVCRRVERCQNVIQRVASALVSRPSEASDG